MANAPFYTKFGPLTSVLMLFQWFLVKFTPYYPRKDNNLEKTCFFKDIVSRTYFAIVLSNSRSILQNSHSFIYQPVLKKKFMHIASCLKFMPFAQYTLTNYTKGTIAYFCPFLWLFFSRKNTILSALFWCNNFTDCYKVLFTLEKHFQPIQV